MAYATLLIALASGAMLFPPVAQANSGDDVFWQWMDNYGYTQQAVKTWGSERNAIKVGKQACDLMKQSRTNSEASIAFYAEHQGVDSGVVGNTFLAGVWAYCPSYFQ
ncbi:MAG: DUF732 domain-containing protein [Candidatus Nanopelagicales bacterium]